MECVNSPQEVRDTLKPEEIFARLIAFREELEENTDRLPDTLQDGAPSEIFLANLNLLTKEEIKSADIYLDATLAILKNKLLRHNKKGVSRDSLLDAYEAAGAGLQILMEVKPKRAYQVALIIWLSECKYYFGRNIPLPKQFEHKEINLPIANRVASSLDNYKNEWGKGNSRNFIIPDLPLLLEHVIELAKSEKDKTIQDKAAAFLPFVRQAIEEREREYSKKGSLERFLDELRNRLLSFQVFGKISVRGNYIELDPNDPDFVFNPDAWVKYDSVIKEKNKETLPISIVKRLGRDMGFEQHGIFLKPIITRLPNGCIKIEITQ